MKKNFLPWHNFKSHLHHNLNQPPYFNEREVWFCSVGLNVGHEQDGKNDKFERPVIVLRKFNQRMFWGIPTTSKVKGGMYHYTFRWRSKFYAAILSQIRVYDSRRLIRRIGLLSDMEFAEIKNQLKKLF